jgi:proteic killer suppression protein
VIKSFKHRGLERFFREGSKAWIQPAHAKKLDLQLFALNRATPPRQMNGAG